MTERAAPGRFRRRLTAAFVLVVALSAGFVAVTTYVLAREYRGRSVRAESIEEARLALALAPATLDAESFERLRAAYEARSDARVLAVRDDASFSSSPDLTVEDIPAQLLTLSDTDEPHVVEADVGGQRSLIVGETGPHGTRYYLFFSLEQMEQGLRELAQVLAGMWVVTLLAAAIVGGTVARRTLRPVAATARAAEAIAAGDLDARLPSANGDDFGTLAASFNHMADEVQRLVQRLAAAAARERRFTADVAHELRTPLTGLTAAAELLADRLDELPDASRRPAEILIADTRRLGDLVLELLELSRLESGAEEPRVEPLRVDAAVTAVVQSAALRRRALIDVDGGDAIVLADPARLRRILANVIDNALTHGAGPVEVHARRLDGEVAIDVVDHGPGIRADELDTVFDRFAKSDRSRTAGGSGLGLAIAREHARSLDGDLIAGNDRSAGARFTIRLPAARDNRDDLGTCS